MKDSYDLITIPGASLGLGSIASSILVSLQLHNPNQVYFFDHEDCGAYGKNNSKRLHVQNLKRAKKIILEGHPSKSVKTFIAGFRKIEEVS